MSLIKSLSIVAATLAGGLLAMTEASPAALDVLLGKPANVPAAIGNRTVQPILPVESTDPMTEVRTNEANLSLAQASRSELLQQRLTALEQAYSKLEAQLADIAESRTANLSESDLVENTLDQTQPWQDHEQLKAEVAADASHRFSREGHSPQTESLVAAWFGQMASDLNDTPFASITVDDLECRETVCEATVGVSDDTAASAILHIITSYIGSEAYLADLTPINDRSSLATISLAP